MELKKTFVFLVYFLDGNYVITSGTFRRQTNLSKARVVRTGFSVFRCIIRFTQHEKKGDPD
jgi:hypothetical protein